MNPSRIKPRLLFFQYEYDERLPAFLLVHKREHVKCLSEFFEVTVIQEDCDFQQVCDSHHPDLALFESGVPNPSCRKLKITNVRACPEIPKLGFLHADAFCCARAGFLSDMDHWGIETFFAIATTAPEHMPAIADRLFIWPNFIDPDIYHDYGQWKSIPVLFTGNKNSIYPWRRQIIRTVSAHYPSLICPHPGYNAGKLAAQVIVGEPYARMLNASWFVPACGTVAREVVRKHFEIPACKACLVTEKTPALEAAGFADMTNCVFADQKNILDKLEYLFKNPDLLNEIIDAGHRLVHSSHTMRNRDQILQWFNLQKGLEPHQTIVQAGPFSSLSIVEKRSGIRNAPLVSNGEHLALLNKGDKALREGRYAEAEGLYLKCLGYIRYMPEPKVRLAVCSLYQGNARKALSWISEPLQFTLAEYKAADPDPVEWAYFIVTLLCLGRVDEALRRAAAFGSLHHPQLDFVRRATDVLRTDARTGSSMSYKDGPDRPSLHQLPIGNFNQWLEQLYIMMRACRQPTLANTISARRPDSAPPSRSSEVARCDRRPHAGSDRVREDAFRFFKKRLRYHRIGAGLKRIVRDKLRGLEGRYRYFLPYRLSEARRDEFFQAIEDLTREEDLNAVLVIGASPGQGSTEALLTGAQDNAGKPPVFCLSKPGRSLRSASDSGVRVKCTPLPARSPQSLSGAVEAGIMRVKEENRIDSFDLVLIDGSELKDGLAISNRVQDELYSARFILLDGINEMPNNQQHSNLLEHPAFVLVEHNPRLRNGYSIFARDGAADHAVWTASGVRE